MVLIPNPIANPVQRELEERALRLFRTPAMDAIPVEVGGRYEIEGRFAPDRPADTTITLAGDAATSRTSRPWRA